ncbi:MAG: hypothetical protein ABIJ34_02060 [archaeon]
MKFQYLFFFVLIICEAATGHLDNGQDIVVNGYKIDFGYSPIVPTTKENTLLAFNIINLTTDEAIEPTSVWIRIAQDDKILFAGNLHPKNKQASISYFFPSPGHYELTVRFEKDNLQLAESDFEIIVEEDNNNYVALFGIPAAILVVIFIVAIKKNSHNLA